LRFLYVLLPPPPISPLFPYTTLFRSDKPLTLDAGVELAPFQIAYQTYGTLNAARSNAVLICHALTGDQHVANVHPVTGKPGWWRSEEHTSELQSQSNLVCRLLLEKKK